MRACLLARGWVENPDPESSFFDLKWCLRTRSIYTPPLLRHQVVNHYSGAGACLTTKYGLLESIQHIRWYFDVNVGTFFPRAMKLGAPAEFQALETEFKWCAAASVLRRVLLDNGLSHEGVPSCEHVHLAVQVCRQQAAFRKDLIDDNAADGSVVCLPALSEAQWATLLGCPCFDNCELTRTGPSRPNSRPSSGCCSAPPPPPPSPPAALPALSSPAPPRAALPHPTLLCPAPPCLALPHPAPLPCPAVPLCPNLLKVHNLPGGGVASQL